MRLWTRRTQPIANCEMTWRELYGQGCCFQNELVGANAMKSSAGDRGWHVGLGRDVWESWDEAGALRPLAFAQAPYVGGMTAAAMEDHEIVFTEEFAYRPWDELAFESYGRPQVSERYTPWQKLMFEEVIGMERAEFRVSDLLDEEQRANGWGGIGTLLEQQALEWAALNDAWDPLLKVLVRIQPRYWPIVRGRVSLLSDVRTGEHYDPLDRDPFVAADALGELGVTTDDIAAAYTYLAVRAHPFDYGDDLALLRQMIPRERRVKFKGRARAAQDFLDAAEMLRRFYRDLTGDLLPDPDIVGAAYGSEYEINDRTDRREKSFGHGPTLTPDASDGRHLLLRVGIYPHTIHVIVEGETEEDVVIGFLDQVIGSYFTEQLTITNIRGVGNAIKVEEVVATILNYAESTVMILDNEGPVTTVVERLIASRDVLAENVLVMPSSFEESNFSDDELVQVAHDIAARPTDQRPAAKLILDGEKLREYHDDRCSRTSGKEKPGLADSLLTLARRPAHGAVQLTKPQLAEGLLEMLVEEFEAAKDDEAQAQLFERRPVVQLLVQRIANPLINQPLDRLSSRGQRFRKTTAE